MSQDKNKTNRPQRRGGPGGMHGGGMPVEKAKNFKESFKRLVGYLSRKKGPIIFVLIMAAGSSVFAIVGPKLLGNATTKIFEGLMGKMMGVPGAAIDFASIGTIILWVLGLYSISAVLSYIQQFVMAGVSQKIVYGMRNEVKNKLSK